MLKCDPPKYVRDYHRYKIKSKQQMKNGLFVFPAGTLFSIGEEPTINKSLTTEQCPHCGMQGCVTVKAKREYFESLFEWFIDTDDGNENE